MTRGADMSHFESIGKALLCMGLAVIPGIETALAEAHRSSTIDEITVTARKREENLQSVPVAISAFTSEQLQVRDIFDLERLADQTPGLSYATNGALTSRRAIIRGVSQQTRVGDETNVATFIDGVYTPGFSGAEFFGFDSLERIEVLKGPQSAVYGRNSFAGAINYITRKPGFEYEYGGQLTAGQGDRRGISGYLSGPIVGDSVALRLDGGFNRSGGSFDNQADGKPLGSADTKFMRLGMIWNASDRLSFAPSLSVQDDFVNPVPATQVADDDPRRIGKKAVFNYSPFESAAGGGGPVGRIYDGKLDVTSNSYWIDPRANSGDRQIVRGALEITYDLGNEIELVALTGYQKRKVSTLNDYNTCRQDIRAAVCDNVSPTAFGTFIGGPLAGGPVVVPVFTGAVEDRDELSQDLRLQSTGGGPLQWIVGLYYSEEDFTDQRVRLSEQTLTSLDGTNIYALASTMPLVDSTALIDNRFRSIYGSIEYDISPMWNVAFEIRYTEEDKKTNEIENNFPSQTPPTGFQSRDFDFVTPRGIVSFTPTDDLLVYISAAKGVKSGGFNPGSASFSTFDEETNWTYELGSKYTFWGGRARLNGAAFFIDWDDQQITATDPDDTRLPITVNVAKTEIKGVELEALLNPTDWLQLNAGATIIDAEYKEGATTTLELLADCADLPIPCDVNLPFIGPVTSGSIAGRKVVGAPDKTFNVGAQVTLPLPAGGMEFFSRVDYSWRDTAFIDEANAGFIPQRDTLNLRIGVQNDRWSIQGYCNNLTDDETPLFALPPRDILGVPHYFVVNRDGRLCGAQVSYRN